MKKIFLVLIVLMFGVTVAACGGDSSDLKIAIYLGGYGQKWLSELAKGFENEFSVKIDIEANPDLASEIPNRLLTSQGDDIFFSHGINWERAALDGNIEELTDLYQQEVENGVKLIDRVESGLLSTARLGNRYFKLPWTNGVGGIVYNAKMFEQYGWEVPETYDELMALCAEIYAENIQIGNRTVTPFVWSQETYYWDYLVFDWWAQLNGVDFFTDYTKADSPSVFNPTTNLQSKAFEAWSKLIAENPWYSMENSDGKQYLAAQLDFINGFAAMMPSAQWLESEMSVNINPEKIEMRMMKAPFLADAKKDNQGNPIAVNYAVGAGDSIIIPANAPHKDLAKKFLLYLARESSLKTFTENTSGVMLAMDYMNVEFDDTKLSKFANDVININQTSQKFNIYSNAPMVINAKINLEWPIEGIQHYSSFYQYYNVKSYFDSFKNNTLDAWITANGKKDVAGFFNATYNSIVSAWSGWLDDINAAA